MYHALSAPLNARPGQYYGTLKTSQYFAENRMESLLLIGGLFFVGMFFFSVGKLYGRKFK